MKIKINKQIVKNKIKRTNIFYIKTSYRSTDFLKAI